MLKKLAAFAFVALWVAGSQSALAVGFGRPSHTTTLGQTLDLVVPVIVDSTEQLTGDCVFAEVLVGDTRLPPSAVRARLGRAGDSGTRSLRVSSTVRIDEPVVTVTVVAGCPARLTKQLVLFIDPPVMVAPAKAVMATAPVPFEAVSPSVTSTAGQASTGDSLVAAGPVAAAVRRAMAPALPPRARTGRASVGVRSEDARATRKPPNPKATRAAARAPRLQLEADSRPERPEAAAAAAVAELMASAASAAAAAASEAQATEQRHREAMQALQKQMDSVKAQADAANKSVAQMQLSLHESQETSKGWLLVAGALAALVVALLGWVAWLLRQRAVTSRADAAWWNAEPNKLTGDVGQNIPPPEGLNDGLPSELELPFSESVHDTNVAMLAESQADQDFTDASSTLEPAITTSVYPDTPSEQDRAPFLTADALIDLGQQADFFVALGQDDSAVNLLNGQLPIVGGGGAWPYLKLLEIHRRQEDRAAFDRVRERFERRFGVWPADWRDEAVAGKSLDSYEGVIKRIEGVWAEPEDAVGLIEMLMLRGDDNVSFFDLAAMGDLQSLYLLAKSLLEPVHSGTDAVDFLLPLKLDFDDMAAPPPVASKSSQTVDSTIGFELEPLPAVGGDQSPPK